MQDNELDHLDPTQEISLETVQKRSVKGIVTLTGRHFILNAISLVSFGLISAFLGKEEIGIFGIVTAAVSFLNYFSDIGLAASLIQKHEKPTDKELKSTFTVQQLLISLAIIILIAITPRLKEFYSLGNDGILLIYALAFSLFMSSLKTIPSILLERKLEFEKIALSNILENLFYNVILVYLAWKGFGVQSYVYAVIVRSIVGFVSLYILEPWKPGFALSIPALKKLLKFGVPYQINTFIAVLKDDGLSLVLGKVLGLEAMGMLIWAQKWIQLPLRIFMDTVTKVTFPAFSRMQGDRAQLSKAVTRSIFFICFFVFPSVIGLIILAPTLINSIPKYAKWSPALIPLSILSINVFFAAVTTQLTNLLNSIGKIKITFMLMVMWFVLTWAAVPTLAAAFGVNGAAIGYALVGSSSMVAIAVIKKEINFSLYHSAIKPLMASLGMGAVMLGVRQISPVNLTSVWLITVVGIISYAIFTLFFVGISIVEDVKKIFKTAISK